MTNGSYAEKTCKKIISILIISFLFAAALFARVAYKNSFGHNGPRLGYKLILPLPRVK
jgi:YbbR domain-containing protein